MHLALALGLASTAFAQHGHHGPPMARQNAHRALANASFANGYHNTSTQSSTAVGTGGPNVISTSLLIAASNPSCGYWLEDIQHQGFSPFNANPASYQVFRNVKDFGAAGRYFTKLRIGTRLTRLQVMESRTTPQPSTMPLAVEVDAAPWIVNRRLLPQPLSTSQRAHILSAPQSSTFTRPN